MSKQHIVMAAFVAIAALSGCKSKAEIEEQRIPHVSNDPPHQTGTGTGGDQEKIITGQGSDPALGQGGGPAPMVGHGPTSAEAVHDGGKIDPGSMPPTSETAGNTGTGTTYTPHGHAKKNVPTTGAQGGGADNAGDSAGGKGGGGSR